MNRYQLKLYRKYRPLSCIKPIPVAARSKAWVCGRSSAGTAGSIPAGGMDVCLLCVLCVVRQRSLRRADHSSREVLPSVVCLSVIINLSDLNCYEFIWRPVIRSKNFASWLTQAQSVTATSNKTYGLWFYQSQTGKMNRHVSKSLTGYVLHSRVTWALRALQINSINEFPQFHCSHVGRKSSFNTNNV